MGTVLTVCGNKNNLEKMNKKHEISCKKNVYEIEFSKSTANNIETIKNVNS